MQDFPSNLKLSNYETPTLNFENHAYQNTGLQFLRHPEKCWHYTAVF